MRAGKLDRRVTIQTATAAAADGLNETAKTWTAVATVWAQKRENRGSERFAASQVAGSAVVTWHIRWRSDVSADDRLLYDGTVYEIVAPPRELGRRVGLEIDTVARAN